MAIYVRNQFEFDTPSMLAASPAANHAIIEER
jgi:hypothetical protein